MLSFISMIEPDWAWTPYLEKGTTGLGQKRFTQFRYGPWQVSIEFIKFVTTQTGGNTKFNLQLPQE